MTVAPLLLTAVSVAVGVMGVVANTSATIAANNYQAQVAERNRQAQELNAQRALARSSAEQQQQDEQTRALLGAQIAAQSASGLRLGGRSQMLTRKSARELGRLDAINVKRAGEVDAYNFRVAAEDASKQVDFLHQSNKHAVLSGFLDAASVGISGVRSLPGNQLSSLVGARKSNVPTYQTRPSLRFAR